MSPRPHTIAWKIILILSSVIKLLRTLTVARSPGCILEMSKISYRFSPHVWKQEIKLQLYVDSSWNVMSHGDARERKWRGNWRMQWVASTLHTTSERGVSSVTTADAHTSAASSRLNWRPSADLNGLVRFAERRNLVSARVPSHFKSSLSSI